MSIYRKHLSTEEPVDEVCGEAAAFDPEYLSTNELAAMIRGKPGSIRTRYCETGSFHGIRPTKTPSGRLLWPTAEARRKLLDGKTSKGE